MTSSEMLSTADRAREHPDPEVLARLHGASAPSGGRVAALVDSVARR